MHTSIVGNASDVLDSFLLERVDHLLRNAADSESAEQDLGTILHIGHSIYGRLVDLAVPLFSRRGVARNSLQIIGLLA